MPEQDAGEREHPPLGAMLIDRFEAVGGEVAPTGQRRLDPDAEEAQEALLQNGLWDGQGGVDDDGAEEIGEQVFEELPVQRDTDGSGCFHEGLCFETEHGLG